MVPIDTINANSDVEVQDSCNCWSSCCEPEEKKDKALTDKIRKIVMEELQDKKEIK